MPVESRAPLCWHSDRDLCCYRQSRTRTPLRLPSTRTESTAQRPCALVLAAPSLGSEQWTCTDSA